MPIEMILLVETTNPLETRGLIKDRDIYPKNKRGKTTQKRRYSLEKIIYLVFDEVFFDQFEVFLLREFYCYLQLQEPLKYVLFPCPLKT